MLNIIEGGFHKISTEQWKSDLGKMGKENVYPAGDFTVNDIKEMYENLKAPEYKTEGAAGHDIHSPYDFTLNPGETIKFPTGYSVEMPIGFVFKIYPRSSLGTKFEATLTNTVGIVDSDYFYSSNEGHMWMFMKNNGNKVLEIKQGEAVAQGTIDKYYVFGVNPNATKRDGGFGSTGK